MGEGTSEIRHLRERVLLHDDMLRGIGERVRLLDELVQRLEKRLVGAAEKADTPRLPVTATGGAQAPAAEPAPAPQAEPRRAPAVRRR